MKNMVIALALSPVIVLGALVDAAYPVVAQIAHIIKTGAPS